MQKRQDWDHKAYNAPSDVTFSGAKPLCLFASSSSTCMYMYVHVNIVEYDRWGLLTPIPIYTGSPVSMQNFGSIVHMVYLF